MTNTFSTMYPDIRIPTDVQTIIDLKHVHTKEVTVSKQNYIMLTCDSDFVCYDNNDIRKYNSIVLDPMTRSILSVTPPMSYELEAFKNLYPNNTEDGTNDTIMVEEMIEGLSFTIFFDYRIKQWEMTTRNSVGGNYSYYRMANSKSKTFKEMLFDFLLLDTKIHTLNDWECLQSIDRKSCYHFILQHPENHIVLNNTIPKLYYTGMHECHIEGIMNKIRYVSCHWKQVFSNASIHIPTLYTFKNDFDDTIADYNPDSLDHHMGIGFLHKYTGDRTFIVHSKYKTLQTLRGTHPNMMFQYICLRRISKVHDFLYHFPQYKPVFWTFFQLYETLVARIHSAYLAYYIQKSGKHVEKYIFYHVSQIHHTIFKPSLNDEQRVIVKKSVVRNYLDGLSPGNVLHMLQNDKYKEDNIIQ
jgi:hypothetical protein